MRVEQLLQPLREVGRHRDEAALALHRLEHGAGDRLRVDVALEEVLQRGDRVVLGDAAERIRRGRAVDLGRERAEALLVRHDLRGHRHREQRAAVEGVVEDDDRGPPGRDARDLDGVLDRLGARVQQDRLLVVATAGRELGEPAADLDVRLVHPDHEALVQVLVDLGVDRLDDGRQRVAEVGAAEAAGEVDVLAPVGVPDARALGAGDDERGRGDAAGDVALAAFLDAARSSFVPAATRAADCIAAYSGEAKVGSRRASRAGPRRSAGGYDARPRGALAEWLGSGLQSRVQRFESARRLYGSYRFCGRRLPRRSARSRASRRLARRSAYRRRDDREELSAECRASAIRAWRGELTRQERAAAVEVHGRVTCSADRVERAADAANCRLGTAVSAGARLAELPPVDGARRRVVHDDVRRRSPRDEANAASATTPSQGWRSPTVATTSRATARAARPDAELDGRCRRPAMPRRGDRRAGRSVDGRRSSRRCR